MVKETDLEIIFFSFNHWQSRFIQEFTDCKWSHVGIISKRENGIVYVHEALNKGSVKSKYTQEQIEVWLHNGTCEIQTLKVESSKEAIYSTCEIYKGTPYGWIDLLFIGLLGILKNKWIKKLKLDVISNLYLGKRRVICSEFVSRVIYDTSKKKYNLVEFFNKKYSLLTPADVYMYCKVVNDEVLDSYIEKLLTDKDYQTFIGEEESEKQLNELKERI